MTNADRCLNCNGLWRAPQHVKTTCHFTIGVSAMEHFALQHLETVIRAQRIALPVDVVKALIALDEAKEDAHDGP